MRRLPPSLSDRCRRSLWVAAAVAAVVSMPTAAWAADSAPAPPPAETPADAAPGTPRPSSEAVKKELTTVIDAQLAAFRSNDYTTAYGFAATEIKGMFAPGDFEKMVRSAYPVIAHSSAADYGLAFDAGDEAVVTVRVSNADKKSVEYQYLLKKEDGHWKIGGVSEVQAQGLSV